MKEPEIIKAINNLQGISDYERESLINMVNNTFYYNPDDYYIFAEKLNSLNVLDVRDFFSKLNIYLEARTQIDEKVRSLSSQNTHAKSSFRSLQEACTKLRLSIREIMDVRDYVKYIMDSIDSPEVRDMVGRRNSIHNKIKDIDSKIDSLNKDTDTGYEEAHEAGKISMFIKAKLRDSKNKRRIEKIEKASLPTKKEYDKAANEIVRTFNNLVSSMPQDKKELFMKYKDLVGYEHFFAIKADFNWYLHNGEIGRLNAWLSKLTELEAKKRSQLADDLDDADELKKKIDARDEVITNFSSHADLFGLDQNKKEVFESYTKRYPGLNNLDTDEIFALIEQSDARVLYTLVPAVPVKVKSLKKYNGAR